MKTATGLHRKIVVTVSVVALVILLLLLLESYGFYAFMMAYWPDQVSNSIIPSAVETIWMISTTLVVLAIAITISSRLARRILEPLNSVAQSLRLVAKGDLAARAKADDFELGEASQLVRDFNGMAERLERMTHERATWNAAIVHELRTPVTILRGRLQGLADGVFKPDQALFAGMLVQVDGLSRLLEDLRVLDLNEAGRLRLQLEEIHLAPEINAVVQFLEPSLRSAGFELALDVDEAVNMRCDPVRIRQALLALLENALHHATPGPLHIGMRMDGAVCHIRVEDCGPGVAPNMQERIFEPFERCSTSAGSHNTGTGLGLAVVKAIALAHGGDAMCLSSQGAGSVFKLSWPTHTNGQEKHNP